MGKSKHTIVYRVSEEVVLADQVEYKKNYSLFRPFTPPGEALSRIAWGFSNLIGTQNGQDTDDYCVLENNKVERFLSGVPAGSKVLLLGVGTGRETLVARDIGFEAYGTTLGSRNIDFGIKYLGLTVDEHLECLNEALPFPAGMFDVVAGFQVFEHTMAPLLFLLEQRRVLSKGGKLVLEWPPAKKHSGGSNPHHQVCFVPGQAKALFEKAGFYNIKLYYDNMNTIPEELVWSGEVPADEMLVIEGLKGDCQEQFILASDKR